MCYIFVTLEKSGESEASKLTARRGQISFYRKRIGIEMTNLRLPLLVNL